LFALFFAYYEFYIYNKANKTLFTLFFFYTFFILKAFSNHYISGGLFKKFMFYIGSESAAGSSISPSEVEDFSSPHNCGWLAQWIARQPSELKVLGSSPRSVD
jgi:hypothetical protein